MLIGGLLCITLHHRDPLCILWGCMSRYHAPLALQVAWVTRIQALQGMLEEAVQDDKAARLQTAVLRFIADQLAALVESSTGALDPDIRQGLVQLMQTATDRMQVSTEHSPLPCAFEK